MKKLLAIIVVVLFASFTLAQNSALLTQTGGTTTTANITQTTGINHIFGIGGLAVPASQKTVGGTNYFKSDQTAAVVFHDIRLTQTSTGSGNNIFEGLQTNTYRSDMLLDQVAGGNNTAYTEQIGNGSRNHALIYQSAGGNNYLDLFQEVVNPLNNTNSWEVYSHVSQWASGNNTLLITQQGRDIDEGDATTGMMNATAGNNYAKLDQFGRHEDIWFDITGTDNTLYMYQEVSGGTVDFIKADVFQHSDGTNYGNTRQVGGGKMFIEADQTSAVSNYLDMDQVGRDISADVWQNSTTGFNSAITSQTVDNATINSSQTGAGNNILNVVQN